MKRALLFAVPLLSGCGRNPNVEIIGSYFPGWMICLAAGLVLTAAAHAWLQRRHAHERIGHPALIYPSILIFFTCLLWLLLFA